jgi:hypothetical protein
MTPKPRVFIFQFDDSFIANLLRLIHHMRPKTRKENDDELDDFKPSIISDSKEELRALIPALAMPNTIGLMEARVLPVGEMMDFAGTRRPPAEVPEGGGEGGSARRGEEERQREGPRGERRRQENHKATVAIRRPAGETESQSKSQTSSTVAIAVRG